MRAANKIIFLTAFFAVCSATAFAYTVEIAEVSRSEYRQGHFTARVDLQKYRFEIDERARKATLMDRVPGKEYRILRIENKLKGTRREKIITFAEASADSVRETFILGESAFEYCKVSSESYVLSSGTVSLSVAMRR